MIGRSSSRALLHHDGLPLPIEVCPIRGARRLRLRIDEKRGILKLTGPKGMSRAKALAWAAEQRPWVEEQLQARLPAEPFAPGAAIPIAGRATLLGWNEGARRTPVHEIGDESGDGVDRLVVGGPRFGFERRIERWLRKLALETMTDETMDMARSIGVDVTSVSVGDAGTRWGSCSSQARIRYSWRLILASPEVRRMVVAHEVAHLRHLDHGREFKALECRLFGGDVAAARRLLRREGPRLRRFGCSD